MRATRYGSVLILACIACGDDANPAMPDAPMPPPDASPMAVAMIDPSGGIVALPGGEATITIPPGSVDSATMITITVSDAKPTEALGPVYTFGPAGQVFAHPVTVELALPAGVSAADVYWSKSGGATGYDNIGGTIASGKITAQVVHFSEGFVGSATTTRTVTGSQKIAWVSASSFQLQAVDLSAFAVAALVEDGAGGYTTIAGVGHSDGTFSIDNVPDGPYWLRVPGPFGGSGFYRTTASAVDAGYTKQGRPDAVTVSTGTNVVLDLTNLATWQSGDQIEAFSSENNSWYFQSETYAATAGIPTAGATALTGYTFDTAANYSSTPHLIEGSHVPPDRFVVAQLSRRMTASNVPYNAMTRVFEPAPFTMTNGQATMLSGAFSDVTTANTIALDIRATAIRASLTEENRPCNVPASWSYGWTIYILGVAGGLANGVSGNTADFMALDLPTTTADVAGTDFSYGTPLQGTWGTYGDARFSQPCEYTPPGASTPTMLQAAGIYVAASLSQFGTAPLTVDLSQVRAPTIDGASLFTANTGISLTPTIAWSAPSVGTPSFYSVAIERLFADGSGNGQHERVAELVTDQTSVRIPAGVLTAGQTYVFGVAARRSGRSDPSAFNREVLPEYGATIFSQMQQP